MSLEKRASFASSHLGSLAKYLSQPANFCIPANIMLLQMLVDRQADLVDSDSICLVYTSVSTLINDHLEETASATEDQCYGALSAIRDSLFNQDPQQDDTVWIAWAEVVVACGQLAWKEQEDAR